MGLCELSLWSSNMTALTESSTISRVHPIRALYHTKNSQLHRIVLPLKFAEIIMELDHVRKYFGIGEWRTWQNSLDRPRSNDLMNLTIDTVTSSMPIELSRNWIPFNKWSEFSLSAVTQKSLSSSLKSVKVSQCCRPGWLRCAVPLALLHP